MRRPRRRPEKMVIRLLLEAPATPRELSDAEELFGRHGFEVRAEAGYPLTGGPVTELTWAVYVVLAVPIAAFLNSFAAEAGRDAYAAAKSWIKDVFDSRGREGPGVLLVLDGEETQLRLHSEWRDEALEALREVDWDHARGGFLTWDQARREWTAAHPDAETETS